MRLALRDVILGEEAFLNQTRIKEDIELLETALKSTADLGAMPMKGFEWGVLLDPNHPLHQQYNDRFKEKGNIGRLARDYQLWKKSNTRMDDLLRHATDLKTGAGAAQGEGEEVLGAIESILGISLSWKDADGNSINPILDRNKKFYPDDFEFLPPLWN